MSQSRQFRSVFHGIEIAAYAGLDAKAFLSGLVCVS
jgi:hypothetical protein